MHDPEIPIIAREHLEILQPHQGIDSLPDILMRELRIAELPDPTDQGEKRDPTLRRNQRKKIVRRKSRRDPRQSLYPCRETFIMLFRVFYVAHIIWGGVFERGPHGGRAPLKGGFAGFSTRKNRPLVIR
jgi:hypothetical protein